MSPLPVFLLQRDEPWTGLIWLFLFVVLPLLARLVRAVLTRAGVVQAEEEELTPQQKDERRRRVRTEQRRTEAEGEDLWRRLARGEDVRVPAPPAGAERREAPERIELAGSPVRGHSLETASHEGMHPDAARETSLESEMQAAPLSVLGAVEEPGEAPEVSLEGSTDPLPLLALGAPLGETQIAQAARVRPALRLARGDLRRAVLLSEILGPPVSDRPPFGGAGLTARRGE